jgi:hypothetical protein
MDESRFNRSGTNISQLHAQSAQQQHSRPSAMGLQPQMQMQMQPPLQYEQQLRQQQAQMQAKAQMQAPPPPVKDFKYYTNTSPIQLGIMMIVFILLSNATIFSLERHMIPPQFLNYENPPLILVLFNSLLFGLCFVLVSRYLKY